MAHRQSKVHQALKHVVSSMYSHPEKLLPLPSHGSDEAAQGLGGWATAQGHHLVKDTAEIWPQASLTLEPVFSSTVLWCNIELDTGITRQRMGLEEGNVRGW